jgi:hypothetical protein
MTMAEEIVAPAHKYLFSKYNTHIHTVTSIKNVEFLQQNLLDSRKPIKVQIL